MKRNFCNPSTAMRPRAASSSLISPPPPSDGGDLEFGHLRAGWIANVEGSPGFERTRRSPSPRPSPPGRGRTSAAFLSVRGPRTLIARSGDRAEIRRNAFAPSSSRSSGPRRAFDPIQRGGCFSLSAGERAGVRGKGRHDFSSGPRLLRGTPSSVLRSRLAWPEETSNLQRQASRLPWRAGVSPPGMRAASIQR